MEKIVCSRITARPRSLSPTATGCDWDARGREYLDFIAGIATSSLGHAHPRLVEAIAGQAERYLHVSNSIASRSRRWRPAYSSRRLARRTWVSTAFSFATAAPEANEAAIKIARKRGSAQGRYKILATHAGFHGRTIGSLAATGTPRYKEGFGPLPEGFFFVDYNDLEGAVAAVDEEFCAVLVEPMQGEGGIHPSNPGYLSGLEALCRDQDLLFMLDEVQTGIGRTGSMFGFHHYGVQPDLITLAKGLGGGVPVGAVVARDEVAALLVPGDHGSTFGGNPLATVAVAAVLETIHDEGLLDSVQRMGERLRAELLTLDAVESVRGLGLLIAAELVIEAAPVVSRCLEHGLLVNAVGPKSVRFAPPLIVTAGEVDRALAIFSRVLSTFAPSKEDGAPR